VQHQDPANLEHGSRVRDDRVAEAHEHCGLDAFSMGAPVVDHAVAGRLERAVAMRSIGGFPGISTWTADDAPNWATATEEQRAEQGFWTDDDGLINEQNPRSVWT